MLYICALLSCCLVCGLLVWLIMPDDNLGHLLQEANDWDYFSSILETVPTLIKRVQELFHAKQQDLAVTTNPDSLISVVDQTDAVSPDTMTAGRTRSRQHRSGSDIESPSTTAAEINAREQYKEREKEFVKVRELVDSSVHTLIRMRGLVPEYVWRLSDDGATTADNLINAAEHRRRQLINSTRFKAEIHINGKTMTQSHYAALNSTNMQVEFRQYFEMRVLNQPKDISIHLYMNDSGNCFRRDTFLGSICLSAPGSATNNASQLSRTKSSAMNGPSSGVTHSFAPAAGWYDFSSLGIDTKGTGFIFGTSSSIRPKIEVLTALFCFISYCFIACYG